MSIDMRRWVLDETTPYPEWIFDDESPTSVTIDFKPEDGQFSWTVVPSNILFAEEGMASSFQDAVKQALEARRKMLK